MMRYLDYARRYGLPFFDANTGGGSGGGSQGGAQGQPAGGGGQGGNGNQQTIKTPFDDLPWDELDDATKKQLETVRDAHVATLQRTQKLEADLGISDKLARRFQSELDRIKADLDKNNRRNPKWLNAFGGWLKNEPKQESKPIMPLFQTWQKLRGLTTKLT
jgi:hypothetical protein